MESNQDVLARAYATLKAIRENIREMGEYNRVGEVFVEEFHTTLEKLEEMGVGVSEFRIPDSLVKPRVTSSQWEGGVTHNKYSDEKYVQKSVLLMKPDTVLGYFEIITGEEPIRMGFKK